MIPFSGMVVHDIQDDLDARTMQRLDHRLELVDFSAFSWIGGISNIRGKIPDGIISPIIGEPLINQKLIIQK